MWYLVSTVIFALCRQDVERTKFREALEDVSAKLLEQVYYVDKHLEFWTIRAEVDS